MYVLDYIKKNKDLSFKELKFNEIDALIFSSISYLNFSKVNQNRITIKEAAEIIDLDKCKDKFIYIDRVIFKKLAESKRYQNIILENYKRVNNKDTQFAAITIVIPKILKFISFEGTEDKLNGWEEDTRMGYMYPVEAQTLAVQYLKDNIKFKDLLVYVGGHSKGGNLAIASVLDSKLKSRLRVKYIFDFDGPGFLKKQSESHKYKRIMKKIKSYSPVESIVGMMMYKPQEINIVKSRSRKVNQHFFHNWQIYNTHFTKGTLTKFSKEFHKKTIKLLEEYSDDERALFAKTLFKLLYSAGYTKKSEINILHITELRNAIKETKKLTDEEKAIIIGFIKALTSHN